MKDTPTPKIGFDRFIRLDWAETALQTRAGMTNIDAFGDMLDATHDGLAAKKKTRTVLNRLWLAPRTDLVEFADYGVEIYRRAPNVALALTWGMAIAAYPFFGRVAEIVGRLTSLHGDCAAAEVHRRMAEIYGEREGTRRMTNMALQSQEDWGCIKKSAKGKIISRTSATPIQGDLILWVSEACLKYVGGSLSIDSLRNHASIFPFCMDGPVTYILSNSRRLNLHADGAGDQVVSASG